MYKIYKDSEMYKFLKCHLFDQCEAWPIGGHGYNFCSYMKDIAKAVGVCVAVYGSLAYCAIFGIAPWILWIFWDSPAPLIGGPGLLSIASILVAALCVFGIILFTAAAISRSLDKTRWNEKLYNGVAGAWKKTSVGEFASTAYWAWKDKYCPLAEALDTKAETVNVD